MNPLLLTDSYKLSHWPQYPKGTEYVYSYLESRGGMFDETTFFGLQYYLKKYLSQQVTEHNLTEFLEIASAHVGPTIINKEGAERLVRVHDGRWPVEIKAVLEGTSVPTGNVLMTIVNTDPEMAWVTNYLETLLLQVWYPITVATLSRECKKLISASLKRTTSFANEEEFNGALSFKLVDFGFRGVSSVESAGIGGTGHLVNFGSTDTLAAIMTARKFYKADMPGFSIPASEHSTITSWGLPNEREAFDNMLEIYKEGPVACVSDSRDITEAVDIHWPALKDKILARNGVLIIRPDSGNIKQTLKYILNSLWAHFGGEVVDGYKILDPHIRVIQGDGMNYDSLKDTLEFIEALGFSTNNLAFGMGGALLQKVDRDTQKFAFKCSAICVDGEWREVFKSPTELDENGNKNPSFKRSKKGMLKLVSTERGFKTEAYLPGLLDPSSNPDSLQTVYKNGIVMRDMSLETIRNIASV